MATTLFGFAVTYTHPQDGWSGRAERILPLAVIERARNVRQPTQSIISLAKVAKSRAAALKGLRRSSLFEIFDKQFVLGVYPGNASSAKCCCGEWGADNWPMMQATSLQCLVHCIHNIADVMQAPASL